MTENILIKNIREILITEMPSDGPLRGSAMSRPGRLPDAWIMIREGRIERLGNMRDFPRHEEAAEYRLIDASGKFVIPAFCDSHTHIVYAGSREQEFVDKISGLSYEEIATRGGGILNSVALLRRTSEEELYRQAYLRVREVMCQGTGSLEIKSGYGLSPEDELKMLRVIRRLKETTPLTIKATFLGAHAIPEEYRSDREEYIRILLFEMIPAVASEGLADFIDVFCDKGFFSVEETERILMTGIKYGLRPKIHANELDYSGGVQTGVKYDALTVDHLERTGREELEALEASETIATLLPGASFFLSLPDPPVREMIRRNIPIALASDYNPGSSPSGNMKLMMSLACIRWKMLPAEALTAATINGAWAMDVPDETGSIEPGKRADIIITKSMPSFEFFPYAFGSDLIDTVILGGEVVHSGNR
ncbi:MAG TPA: imidazolonepropionase [Bacteroidales bacterium]|nr:imidazolonepropionase [Bacteroidales bacterium]